jgi:S1-C subfamily serine protease
MDGSTYPSGVLGSVVDLILIVLIIMFAVNGYRQGFVVGALSFVGFFGGALVGLQLAPLVVEHVDSAFMRVAISLAAVFGLAVGGQALAAWAGTKLQSSISTPGGRKADSIGGVFVSVVALLLVAWMVAGPLGSSTVPSVNRAVRNSAIITGIDRIMPNQARVFYNGLRDTIASGAFPNVFGDLTPTRARQVNPPDPALINSKAVALAQGAVVKITGTAPSCRRKIEGSGFIFAPQHVMTNAHVVAGTQGPVSVQLGGATRSGRVVFYDPELDLAVIDVPGLTGTVLNWAGSDAATGDDAVVIGYPLNGPFTAVSARIRDKSEVRGPDIYNSQTVVRQVYSIRSTVKSGNSGGPLLDPNGALLGVIFAAALDDPETGFALTANVARPVADSNATRTDAVDTGACT